MTEEEFYETAPLKRRTYLLLFVLLGGMASLAAVGKALYDSQADVGYCPVDGLIRDDGPQPRRDPAQGCRWVDENDDFIFECSDGSLDCNWQWESRIPIDAP